LSQGQFISAKYNLKCNRKEDQTSAASIFNAGTIVKPFSLQQQTACRRKSRTGRAFRSREGAMGIPIRRLERRPELHFDRGKTGQCLKAE